MNQSPLLQRLHPLFFATLFLLAGIVFAATIHPAIIAACIIGIWLLGRSSIQFSKPLVFIVSISSFFLGMLTMYHQNLRYDHALACIKQGNSVTFFATVEHKKSIADKQKPDTLQLKIDTAFMGNKREPLLEGYRIIVFSTERITAKIDDIIILKNVMLHASSEKNKSHAMREKIIAHIFCKNIPYKLFKRPAFSINRWIFNQKTRIARVVKSSMPTSAYHMYATIFSNEERLEDSKAKRSFTLWGIGHYLARSGLHVIIFIALWHFILKFFPCDFFAKNIILMFLVALYWLFSWISLSFSRAIAGFFIQRTLFLCGLSVQSLHMLCLISYPLLLVNPIVAFGADFQLSFGLTWAIMWFFENHGSSSKEPS